MSDAETYNTRQELTAERDKLLNENARLRAKLRETAQTLRAIAQYSDEHEELFALAQCCDQDALAGAG